MSRGGEGGGAPSANLPSPSRPGPVPLPAIGTGGLGSPSSGAGSTQPSFGPRQGERGRHPTQHPLRHVHFVHAGLLRFQTPGGGEGVGGRGFFLYKKIGNVGGGGRGWVWAAPPWGVGMGGYL